jgi:hypothetical protein
VSRPTRTKGRGCGTKMRHRTTGAAWRHVARLVARGAAYGALEPYRCDCGWYHVGHRPGRKRRAA